MPTPRCRHSILREFGVFVGLCLFSVFERLTVAAPPDFATVFPPGGQAGQEVTVTISGSGAESVRSLQCSAAGVESERLDSNRFRLRIPLSASPGMHDLWAVSDSGLSPPRSFVIGTRPEANEPDDDKAATPMAIAVDSTVNGRIDKSGDTDAYRFEARRGQHVVIECLAERIDSRLRAVLELFDSQGRRLAVNRGYFGVDPLIDFTVPADGIYVVKVQDLAATGSLEHVYRLDVDTGPRVAFTMPGVVTRGQGARLSVFGWNLKSKSADRPESGKKGLDRVEIDLPASQPVDGLPVPVLLSPPQAVLNGFAYRYPNSHATTFIGLTDSQVVTDAPDNHTLASAQEITCPIEVCGRLAAADERDWYALKARRGEVFHFETYADRIGSPMDLSLVVYDEGGSKELARFSDSNTPATTSLPTGHLDPVGRWVAPSDGRFLIALKNRISGLNADDRRVYRLSVRREVPDFHLVAVPPGGAPAAMNVPRGGRSTLEVVAIRQGAFQGSIRVFAENLPPGVTCPDMTIGQGADRSILTISASSETAPTFAMLKLTGEASAIGERPVRGATFVRGGTPIPWARLTSGIPLAVAGESKIRISADAHEPLKHQLYGTLEVRHSPGSVVDVAVRVDRNDPGHLSELKLIGEGLPESIETRTGKIAAGEIKGYLSLYLPPTLPEGRFSFVVRAETTVPSADPKKPETVVIHSEPVTIDVQPAAFLVEADPFAVTRARRGEVIQIAYSSKRRNGFIGKMHTEIAAPGLITDVVGLRGRGETFVGQTDRGSLQIVVNDDAPLGIVPALRLFTVGVVEDEPVYQGSRFLTLEIVE